VQLGDQWAFPPRAHPVSPPRFPTRPGGRDARSPGGRLLVILATAAAGHVPCGASTLAIHPYGRAPAAPRAPAEALTGTPHTPTHAAKK
jgi:hypothetical protein